MSLHNLSQGDLQKHLSQQLGSLQRAAQLFDEGYLTEALRMAVSLRVLLHTNRYPSLLKQLGQHEVSFVDTASPFEPENLLSTHSLVSIAVGNDGLVSYQPKLDGSLPATLTPFEKWWNAVVFSDQQKRMMSRRDVVLTAADQDGGAHVDQNLRTDYAALRFKNSLGWTNSHDAPLVGDPIYAAIRQIGHEVIKTLVPGYKKSQEEVRASRKTAEISGGKMRFYPHSRSFFENRMVSPLIEAKSYYAEIVVDSITTGAVMMIGNGVPGTAVTAPGISGSIIVAGAKGPSGVLGDFTDAVVDCVSIKEIPA